MRHPIICATCVILLACGAAAQETAKPADTGTPGLEAVLRYVPHESPLVVVLPNLDAFVSGVQAFGRAIGVDELISYEVDEFWDAFEVDALPEVWRDCIETNGPIVLAQLEPDGDPMFIGTIGKPPTADADPNDETHIQVEGKIIIAAPDQGILESSKAAKGKFAKHYAERAAELTKANQIMLWIDVPSFSADIGGALGMVQMGAQALAAATPGNPQMSIAFVNWLCEKVRVAADECEMLLLAGRVGKSGVHLTQSTHFRADGTISEYLRGVRKPTKNLLRGIPPQRAVMLLAAEWQTPPDTKSLLQPMAEVTLATIPPSTEQDEAAFKRMCQTAIDSYRLIDGYNGAVMLEPGKPMRGCGIYFSQQPKKLHEAFGAVWELSKNTMMAMGEGITVDLAHEQEQIGSTKADAYRFAIDCEDEQVAMLFDTLYGDEMWFYTLPHPEGVGFAMGSKERARKYSEAMLETGTAAPLADSGRVKQALAQLSPEPQALALMDVPGLALYAMSLEAGMAPPTELFFDPDKPLPYMAFGLYLHKTRITAELDVPAAVIQKIVEVAESQAGGAPTSQEAY